MSRTDATEPTPTAYDAILLTSFGGPESQDEVVPFLERVTAGRGIPAERLLEVGQHYVKLGGVSPINAQNRALLAAMREHFPTRGIDLPIYWGNRNSAPYFADVLKEIHADGHKRVLAFVTSAYSSYSGCRQYRENLAGALAETGLADQLRVEKIRQYYDLPGFTAPVTQDLVDAIRNLAANRTDSVIMFTTHSIPTSMAETSGPESLRAETAEFGGTYTAQHLEVAEEIMTNVGHALATETGTDVTLPDWRLVYQSRSGSPHTPWLEPDINDAIAEEHAAGRKAVIVVPIGFISDHVEVIWDLDTQAAETAANLGLEYKRVRTAGIAPEFVDGIADLVLERLDGTLSSTAPFCAANCCPNPRVQLPVVAESTL
jgi:protoporphyrin/coproporphyrin ferrochelatase